MITAVFKILNCGLTLTPYAFADHHTENLQIFEVNAWVNLDLYGTLVRGAKNGWTDSSTMLAGLFFCALDKMGTSTSRSKKYTT